MFSHDHGLTSRPCETFTTACYAFGSSDGLFNLGSALSFVQALRHGVYIAMNGQYFLWNRVRKNKETGIFERL